MSFTGSFLDFLVHFPLNCMYLCSSQLCSIHHQCFREVSLKAHLSFCRNTLTTLTHYCIHSVKTTCQIGQLCWGEKGTRIYTSLSNSLFFIPDTTIYVILCVQLSATLWMSSRGDCVQLSSYLKNLLTYMHICKLFYLVLETNNLNIIFFKFPVRCNTLK